MPGIDGTQVIEAAVERYPGIIGVVITGYGTMKDAVEAIKRGASDFIAKPFQFDELMHVLQKALEQRRLKSENAYLRSQLEERYSSGGIIGRQPADAAAVSAARDRRSRLEQHDPDHRRNRNRQGSRRAGRSITAARARPTGSSP